MFSKKISWKILTIDAKKTLFYSLHHLLKYLILFEKVSSTTQKIQNQLESYVNLKQNKLILLLTRIYAFNYKSINQMKSISFTKKEKGKM